MFGWSLVPVDVIPIFFRVAHLGLMKSFKSGLLFLFLIAPVPRKQSWRTLVYRLHESTTLLLYEHIMIFWGSYFKTSWIHASFYYQVPYVCISWLRSVTHICVSELTIIGSDNGLSPGRRQAIIWNNAGLLLIEPLGTNFSEISIIQTFSFQKMHLNMSSAKWRPFSFGFNVLRQGQQKVRSN